MSLCRCTLISPSVNLLLTVILHLTKPHLCLSKKTCVSWFHYIIEVSVAFFGKVCYHSLERYGGRNYFESREMCAPKISMKIFQVTPRK